MEPRLAPADSAVSRDRLACAVPQVTVHYDQKDGAVIPKRVHTIVISVQHDDCISLEEQKRVLKEKVRDGPFELHIPFATWHKFNSL